MTRDDQHWWPVWMPDGDRREAGTDNTTARRLVVRARGVRVEAGDDATTRRRRRRRRRRGNDDAATTRRDDEVTTQRHGPNVATEMLPPSRADAGTRRHGDDEAATTTASLPLQPRLTVATAPRSQSLQCPGRHRSFRPLQPRCCSKPSGALTVPAASRASLLP